MVFKVTPEQIEALDSKPLVDLMHRLLLAEARATGIALSNVAVPLQITVPDGGEDGRIAWDGGADSTDWLPSRFTLFQSKATRLGPAAFKAVVWKEGTGGSVEACRKNATRPAEPNDASREVIERGGSYVLFTSAPMTGQAIARAENAIRAGMTEAGLDTVQCAAIKVYDANMITAWTNAHPSVAARVHETTRGRDLDGFETFDWWSEASHVARAAYVDDSSPRFAVEGGTEPPKEPGGEHRHEPRPVSTFEATAGRVAEHIGHPRRIVRVAGPSGYGKSRFVHQLFAAGDGLRRAIDANAVVHADLRDVSDRANRLALNLAQEGSHATSSWTSAPTRSTQDLRRLSAAPPPTCA